LFYAADRIEAGLRVIFRQQTGNQPALNFAAAYLLSQMIEQVSGQSVFNFACRYLFQPLGIATYAAGNDDLSHDPMVGFELKALDLAKIGYLLAREGDWDGQQIVSEQWVRWLFFKVPQAEFGDTPGGGWGKTTIRRHESFVVQGYIECSALGELRLPADLHIVKENGVWKWQGFVGSKQSG